MVLYVYRPSLARSLGPRDATDATLLSQRLDRSTRRRARPFWRRLGPVSNAQWTRNRAGERRRGLTANRLQLSQYHSHHLWIHPRPCPQVRPVSSHSSSTLSTDLAPPQLRRLSDREIKRPEPQNSDPRTRLSQYIQNVRNNKTHNRTPKWAIRAGLVKMKDPRAGRHQWANRYDGQFSPLLRLFESTRTLFRGVAD